MTHGFCGFLLLGDGEGCGEGAGCMAGGGPGFRDFNFFSIHHDENKNIKLNKNKITLSIYRKSPCC